MNKGLLLIVFSITFLSSMGIGAQPTIQINPETTDILQCSQPAILDYSQTTSVSIKEATTYLQNPGQPILPVISKTYTFPLGTTISSVSCEPLNPQDISIVKPVIHAQKPVSQLPSQSSPQPIGPDDTIYSSDNLYPN